MMWKISAQKFLCTSWDQELLKGFSCIFLYHACGISSVTTVAQKMLSAWRLISPDQENGWYLRISTGIPVQYAKLRELIHGRSQKMVSLFKTKHIQNTGNALLNICFWSRVYHVATPNKIWHREANWFGNYRLMWIGWNRNERHTTFVANLENIVESENRINSLKM